MQKERVTEVRAADRIRVRTGENETESVFGRVATGAAQRFLTFGDIDIKKEGGVCPSVNKLKHRAWHTEVLPFKSGWTRVPKNFDETL